MYNLVLAQPSAVSIDWEHRRVCLTHLTLPRLLISITYNDITVKGENLVMNLPDNMKFQVTVQALDAKGNPAQLDGEPVWTAATPETVDVVTDETGTWVVAKGPLGPYHVDVAVDADLGEGVKQLFGFVEGEVIASEAVVVNVVPGPLTPQ